MQGGLVCVLYLKYIQSNPLERRRERESARESKRERERERERESRTKYASASSPTKSIRLGSRGIPHLLSSALNGVELVKSALVVMV